MRLLLFLLFFSSVFAAEEQKNLNEELRNYGTLAEQAHPEFGSGKLYYNFANTFYRLGEYPYALLYYSKALRLRPDDPNVIFNLEAAKEQMGQSSKPERAFLPLPLQLQLFALFCVLFFLFWSLFLWFRSSFYKISCLVALLLSFCFLLSALYSWYFTPIEGIVVRAAALYASPSGQKSPDILFSGSKVQVLNIEKDGEWVKILTDEGRLGYIPSHSLEVI